MVDTTLTLESGREVGTRRSRRLRRDAQIPGVLYGYETAPTPVVVDRKALRAALTTDAGLNALLTLELDGGSKLAVVKELQRDPIRNDAIHVDFLVVDPEAEVTVDVPIHLTGESRDVEQTVGGTLEHLLHELTVACRPDSIPNELVIDITDIAIGDTIRVGDITLPPGVRTEVDADDPVVSTSIVQEVVEEPVVPEGEELEGLEGEAAEGEAEGEGAEAAEAGDSGDEG